MQVAVMPKTYREHLSELKTGESILIDADKRQVWANNVQALNRDTDYHYTIRTDKANSEIRVWRLK